jgi:RNA polymerase sigma-70 factor (ECF subfamily)
MEPLMSEQNRDEWLMAEVGRGKSEALEPLIRRHASPLLTFLTRMLRDAHRGEELFQEVFLAVWQKRRQYQYPRPFKSWLYAIAVNRCREAFRRAPTAAVPLDERVLVGASGGSPVETAIAAETALLVDRAVALLPLQQRTVVVLRVWQQMPYGNIADILETTEGAVRANMHNGLVALRRHLEPCLGKEK